MSTLSPGDVVVLKGGDSPYMTILEVIDNTKKVKVCWFRDGTPAEYYFPEIALRKIEE
ncbi:MULTISPECIES: hypothetical protein [Achromobacter]|uniref:DUF2158 domain-containing protein n=1 Tax=Achromobacter ruhlandii TaxID=72557 RepID=A0A6S7ECT1_9BURK|nr:MULTISPECIES: hypothetical protein [Achromobacter]MCZ8393448.1 hypothetical protein [Achromobacter xylosoxidans]CAB3904465.1 hypothetical protein LMG3328_04467 [Achromobacter ruhlandii]